MLQKEKFNGRVLIFPLLEIEFQNISVNLERADILVFTSVYAAEKLNLELKNSETPIFAVGQRCDEFLREIGAKETFQSTTLIVKSMWFISRKGLLSKEN